MSTDYNLGYTTGFDAATKKLEVVYRERLAALEDIKAEYDRAFCVVRNAGVTRDRTKRLSVGVYLLTQDKS